jgi:long-chain acyl-CoA synthetase
MFLPLAHALVRMVEFVALDSGSTLSYWSRDPKRLLDDLALARPTHLPSVPRLNITPSNLETALRESRWVS